MHEVRGVTNMMRPTEKKKLEIQEVKDNLNHEFLMGVLDFDLDEKVR